MSSLRSIEKLFTGKKLFIPILIGLSVSGYFLFRDFDLESFQSFKFSPNGGFWLVLAFCMVLLRLAGYTYRLYVLSDKKINLRSSMNIVILWEFASAITPGIVGGTAVALGIISQEKNINSGRSTAIVMATSYLDVLFYVLCIPILCAVSGISQHIPLLVGPFSHQAIFSYFLTTYSLFLGWVVIVHFGLFIKPKLIGTITKKIFSIPVLRKFSSKSEQWSNELEIAANELKNKDRSFWLKSFFHTSLAWFARFALVNFLILAFGNGTEVLAIFTKQLIMWGALIIPITPGASGLAEVLFTGFLSPYFDTAAQANTTSLIWRLISFYPYIIAGTVVFPIWLRNKIKRLN